MQMTQDAVSYQFYSFSIKTKFTYGIFDTNIIFFFLVLRKATVISLNLSDVENYIECVHVYRIGKQIAPVQQQSQTNRVN